MEATISQLDANTSSRQDKLQFLLLNLYHYMATIMAPVLLSSEGKAA